MVLSVVILRKRECLILAVGGLKLTKMTVTVDVLWWQTAHTIPVTKDTSTAVIFIAGTLSAAACGAYDTTINQRRSEQSIAEGKKNAVRLYCTMDSPHHKDC